ncbi:unnamed protein product [Phytophthora lilii]|uniref:Unnamed protein product n=1 Tax=Phytophthora lilii TaxID=2077276 RepID=A0A9W6TCJ9_9STRA|nr:unnamed protein product [Phytophthora lilii]
MVRTDAVPLTRSPAEISAINSLHSLRDLLQYSQRPQSAKLNDREQTLVVTSSVTALRSLCGSHGRRQSITSSSTHTELGALERWLALAEVSAKLDSDVESLEREIQCHERKHNALTRANRDGSSPTRLPLAEACELGPKLQCLQEVLGSMRFRAYCRDLSILVRNLRLRLELYGIRFQDFKRQLCRERTVSVEKLLWLFNETERSLFTAKPQPEGLLPIEHADYTLLLQHCSDPGSGEGFIVTADLMELLHSLPLERATLVRYVFEQLADTRRGEGYRPPPDHTRIHHIHAAIKLQRSHCSVEETQAAEAWLEVVGSGAITLQDLLQFHLTISDANVSEDAEFVRFVQRMWGFDPLAVKDADRGEAIQHLLENYTARCHLLELGTRKRELLGKIPGAQSRIRSTSALLESELQHLRVLQAPTKLSQWLQCDESINARLGETLILLREVTLSGQLLTAIPEFMSSLKELQVLDLRDNRLSKISPLGALKTIRKLDLSDNLLRDASFAQADETWRQLEVLTELRLSGNKLTSLPSALVAVPGLQALDISKNSLRSVRGEVIQGWKGRAHLVALDLHGNSLTTLPEEINVLFGSLRRLILHQNHLVALPNALTELIKLEELSLSQNQLSSNSLSSYPLSEGHIAILLDQNQLRVFPCLDVVQAEGKGPPKNVNNSLITIDARGNQLRRMVDWSSLVLANCQHLHLQNNSLRELPETLFSALPALRTCELQNNQLRNLPVQITECTQLQHLDVHDNCLQSLPTELTELADLEVLNAAENDITDIPVEWHAFENQNDGVRVLHSLFLRRNPLRNKILRSIVNGSTDGSMSVCMAATADDSTCEGVIKKLLDGLRDASVILRSADTARVSTRKAWVDLDEEDEEPETSNKPKWRGVARDVNHYLEQRLRAMQRTCNSSVLFVEVKSFERMIRTLPFTCSKRELTHLVRRFLVKDESGRTGQVDGLAFLQAIERFGRWRSISMPSKRPMTCVAKPTIDSAGPIIQYLVVLRRHLQQQQELEKHDRQNQNDRARSPQSKNRFNMKLRMKQREQMKTAHRDANRGPSTAKRKPTPRTNQGSPKFEKTSRIRADVIADRQRQRIQVLEQQLVDQKLLLLAHQKPELGARDNNGPAIAPADLETVAEEDHDRCNRRTVKSFDDGGGSDHAVIISVKCLHLPGTDKREEVGEQQAMKGPARVDLRLQPDDSVLHLKQQLETRTGVPVDHQIIVAHSVSCGAPAIRLRNNSVLREYAEHVGGASRWSLTLFIGQSLPLAPPREAL